jgi:drug/metabolite transporter (DMT)-like permease
MIELILAILFSSGIFAIFKLFVRFQIDTFQAIVFNYFTAALCGFGLYWDTWEPTNLIQISWIPFAFVSGILFISLFVILGLSSQRNGVAITSVATKMSMATGILGMIFLYNESVGVLKVVGILSAIIGVVAVSWVKSKNEKGQGAWWMLLLLFFGSGLLDVVLNYAQKNSLGTLTPALFSAFGLAIAGIFGLLILIGQLILGKSKIDLKNILAGVVLGVPNYFSIYLLISSYQSTGWTDSTVLSVINVSVVLISTLIGLIFFQEKINRLKLIGLIFSLSAITLLYFAES